MGLDITFFKTKEHPTTEIEYDEEQIELLGKEIAYFRNAWNMKVVLSIAGCQNDHIIYITDEIIEKLTPDCFPSWFTVESYEDAILKLKQAMVNNNLIAHINY